MGGNIFDDDDNFIERGERRRGIVDGAGKSADDKQPGKTLINYQNVRVYILKKYFGQFSNFSWKTNNFLRIVFRTFGFRNILLVISLIHCKLTKILMNYSYVYWNCQLILLHFNFKDFFDHKFVDSKLWAMWVNIPNIFSFLIILKPFSPLNHRRPHFPPNWGVRWIRGCIALKSCFTVWRSKILFLKNNF